jgi:GWxTD domain-containing protein
MKTVGWIVVAIACVLPLATAQVEVSQKEEIPPYHVDAMSFASNTSKQSRVDIFIQVPYENLAFVKKDDRYHASYEMTIDILDSTGRLFSEKLWIEEVKAETFEQSVSSQAYSLVERVFEVPPGVYSITTILRDNETRQSQRLMRKLAVSDYSIPTFSLSDVMLVSKFTVNGEKKTLVPSVSPNVGLIPDAFHIFFEAYNEPNLDSVRLVVDILNEKKEKTAEVTQVQKLAPGRNQVFMRIENGSLAIGDYTLYIRAFPVSQQSGEDEKYLAATSRAFVVRWRGLPKGVKDIDLAIEQAVYEAKDSEMSYMREAKTPEEKQKRFLEFWKKRDPNPNTPRNEKMIAYYAKVEYANKTFKHYIEGWRTDMGMVYIIFGPPNNVDRHPFDIDSKPFEVWSYYEMNHQFVFVDQTGFGDYRLTTPIWEVWQRPRD